MISVIGITGLRGSGKDSVGEILHRRFGYEKFAFADPLKTVVKAAFALTEDHMTDRVLKEKVLDRWPNQSPRELLQFVGTELFRASYPGIWVNAWDHATRNKARVVAPDVRFQDEAALIRSRHGIIIRVLRPGLEADSHVSESGQASLAADYIIENDGDLTDLDNTVCAVLGGIV